MECSIFNRERKQLITATIECHFRDTSEQNLKVYYSSAIVTVISDFMFNIWADHLISPWAFLAYSNNNL